MRQGSGYQEIHHQKDEQGAYAVHDTSSSSTQIVMRPAINYTVSCTFKPIHYIDLITQSDCVISNFLRHKENQITGKLNEHEKT